MLLHIFVHKQQIWTKVEFNLYLLLSMQTEWIRLLVKMGTRVWFDNGPGLLLRLTVTEMGYCTLLRALQSENQSVYNWPLQRTIRNERFCVPMILHTDSYHGNGTFLLAWDDDAVRHFKKHFGSLQPSKLSHQTGIPLEGFGAWNACLNTYQCFHAQFQQSGNNVCGENGIILDTTLRIRNKAERH